MGAQDTVAVAVVDPIRLTAAACFVSVATMLSRRASQSHRESREMAVADNHADWVA